jgi:hypothetical protein
MKKFNKIAYNKLLLQAQEAKDQGLNKLSTAIFYTIGSMPEDSLEKYNYDQLKDDVYNGLWNLAGNVIKYHNLESVDSEKINSIIESLTDSFIEEIEENLQLDDGAVGPLESEIPGEIK